MAANTRTGFVGFFLLVVIAFCAVAVVNGQERALSEAQRSSGMELLDKTVIDNESYEYDDDAYDQEEGDEDHKADVDIGRQLQTGSNVFARGLGRRGRRRRRKRKSKKMSMGMSKRKSMKMSMGMSSKANKGMMSKSKGRKTPSPTSTAPTTAAPTTIKPTTAAPTTAAPTTAAPITPAPTTSSPTSATPTTAAPISANPTAPPTTNIPATGSGTTNVPAVTTGAPTPPSTTIQQCVDNPQTWNLNVDVQIQFLDDEFAACDDDAQAASINTNIQDALNTNFAATVTDWQGTATFGAFVFDLDQEVNNVDPFALRLRRSTLLRGRYLQDETCPTRTVDCAATVGDYCRWGCIGVSTTDCGNPSSPTTSWPNLAEDVRARLAGLGFECLGIADQLQVVVTEPTLVV